VLFSVAKDLPKWIIMVKKIKAIYHTLNWFNMDVTQKCLIGECWIPQKDMYMVQKALADGSTAVGSTVPSFLNVISTDEVPPTFNRTNKFTQGFQNLIDAFGVANYREANPSLYTIITFPFLFAIMFGDLGHGLIMFCFGFWMVICEKSLMAKRSKNEIWNIFFGGRYIILVRSRYIISIVSVIILILLAYGNFLVLHRIHLQRHLLQVDEYLWDFLENQLQHQHGHDQRSINFEPRQC
jgi:V-type H+-transporting ATPase subunit a